MSPRTKNTPEDWKRTRFCAHTHKKKQGHAYSLLLCCVIGTRRSIDFARSIVTFWLARGGFVGPIRERPTSRSLFFRSEFDARCTAIFPSALRSIQNALEAKKTPNKLSTRARENTQKTHREKKKKKKKKKKKRNNDAPVYCSTSDLLFTLHLFIENRLRFSVCVLRWYQSSIPRSGDSRRSRI